LKARQDAAELLRVAYRPWPEGYTLDSGNVIDGWRSEMAISVEYRVEVKAGAEKIWGILTDVESWPSWQGTPYVKLSAPGRITEGSTFEANPGGLKWKLTVTSAQKPRNIVWEGRRLGVKAVHGWEFDEAGGKTTAVTKEKMTGWTLFLAYPMVKKRLSSTDDKWLADLKVRAEKP